MVRIMHLLLIVVALLGNSAHAMGKGQTKIDFKATAGDNGASSRLVAKLDVKSTYKNLPETGSSSGNDNLAGASVTLTIGSATFSGTADVNGKVTTPFEAKITGNGKDMQIKANGLNLEQLFPLDVTDGKDKTVTVNIKVTATTTVHNIDGDGTGGQNDAGTTVETVLSEQAVVFKYSVKNGVIKGKSF